MSIGSRTEDTLFHPRRARGAAYAVALIAVVLVPAQGLAQDKTARVKVKMPDVAASAFVKIGDIDGESQDEDHRNWSDVRLVRWGDGGAEPRRRGGPVLEDVVVIKEMDKASPKLLEAIAKGTMIPTVHLDAPAAHDGSGESTYLAYKLKNVRITSYSINASGNVPIEEITLQYEAIERKERPVVKGQKILEN